MSEMSEMSVKYTQGPVNWNTPGLVDLWWGVSTASVLPVLPAEYFLLVPPREKTDISDISQASY